MTVQGCKSFYEATGHSSFFYLVVLLVKHVHGIYILLELSGWMISIHNMVSAAFSDQLQTGQLLMFSYRESNINLVLSIYRILGVDGSSQKKQKGALLNLYL